MITEKAKVAMLPTTERAFLYVNQHGRFGIYNGKEGMRIGGTHEPPFFNNQHLYFTTDEEIKEGDWYIFEFSKNTIGLYQFKAESEKCEYYRKIVATTNPDLWYVDGEKVDVNSYTKEYVGVPKIPKDFIEAYVRAEGKIEEVLLEYVMKSECLCKPNTNWWHHNLATNCKHEVEDNYNKAWMCDRKVKTLKLNSQGAVVVHKIKPKMYSREDLKTAVRLGYDRGRFGDLGDEFESWFNKHYPQ